MSKSFTNSVDFQDPVLLHFIEEGLAMTVLMCEIQQQNQHSKNNLYVI